jgi:hypothetical protein
MIDDHYPVLAAQLGRCAEGPEREPEDDDGLTGPGDDEPERDYLAERDKERALCEDAEDYRRELARFDAEGRGR